MKRRRRGLSVMETVLGFTLASLGVAAVLAMLNTSFLLSAQSQHGVHAEQVLQQMVELYGTDCQRWVGAPYALDPVYGVDEVVFTRNFEVRQVQAPADGAPALNQIRVETSWKWKNRPFHRERVRLQCLPAR